MSRTLRPASTRPAARRGAVSRSVASLDELKARGVVVVTKGQIAAAFQVSERTITKMMGRKEIPFFRVGERLVRFRVEVAIKHMEAGGKAEILKAESRNQKAETAHLTQPSAQCGEGAAVMRRNWGVR